MMKKKIFLSYARKDREAALRLYGDLTSVPDVEVWIDDLISPGLNWRSEIFKAIRESRYFVALFSKESSTERGFRNTELSKALEILTEFPDGEVYFIPTRLEKVEPPFDAVRALHYADLFPDWDKGVKQLCRALKIAPPVRPPKADPAADHHYRVRLVTLDGKTPELKGVAAGLNEVQKYFHFEIFPANPTSRALRRLDGSPHLDISRLSLGFYRKVALLEMDHVICATHRFLRFEKEDWLYTNYLGCSSPRNERVAFLSTRYRSDYAAEAGVSFRNALAYGLVARLAFYLLDVKPHRVRGCPLDFTRIHSQLIRGLKNGRFCRYCVRSLNRRDRNLAVAVNAMLAWDRPAS